MGRKSPIIATLIVLLLALPWPAQADEEEAFRLAENTFQYQDYEKAVELLTALFEPEMKLKDPARIRLALEYLGAAHWFLGNNEASEKAFYRLLQDTAEYKLDPLFYPPTLVQLFDEIVDKLGGFLETETETETTEKTPTVKPTIRIRREIVEHHPYITAFVPFGVGQFYNGDNVGGSLFLVSEVLALGTAVTSYYMLLNTAKTNPELALKWETAFWVSQSVFLGLAITGIVEAMLRYNGDSRRIEEFDETVPVDEDKTPSGDESSGSLVPQLGISPNGGIMIGIGHRF